MDVLHVSNGVHGVIDDDHDVAPGKLTVRTIYTLERLDGHVYAITRHIGVGTQIAGPMDDVIDGGVVDPSWLRDVEPDDPGSVADAVTWYYRMIYSTCQHSRRMLDKYVVWDDGSMEHFPQG